MNFSQLTRKEKKILLLVAKPYFPTGSLWCIIVLAADGIAAIVFSLRDCLIASEMVKHENPEAIMVVWEKFDLPDSCGHRFVFSDLVKRHSFLWNAATEIGKRGRE